VSKQSRKHQFDHWFPTLVRYGGLFLLLYSAIIDMGRNPALIPAATGMIFLKTVYGGDKEE
jgi:hypothetical protein